MEATKGAKSKSNIRKKSAPLFPNRLKAQPNLLSSMWILKGKMKWKQGNGVHEGMGN